MPKRKAKEDESLIEKAEKAVKKTAGELSKELSKDIEKVVEKAKEEAEDIVESVKEKVEDVVEALSGEKNKKEKKKSKKQLHKGEIKEELEKKDKKSKLEALREKAKELEKKVSEPKIESADIKQKVQAEEEKIDTLVSIEDYLKSSIHLGTRVITPDMRPYVYKRRADGLAVFNTALLDKKIRESSDFLSNYSPQDVLVVCKREAGWKALELFSKITGITIFTKKYPAGILTNPILDKFREAELVVICDPWIDKNALYEAQRIKIPVLAICDTNNYTLGVTQILPGNNKSAKSLGMIFYLLAKLYTEKRKLEAEIPPISEWIENWDILEPPK